jgi:hypothetical protein
MTGSAPPEHEGWERACLEALQRILARLRGTTEELDVTSIGLEGSYPDTRIVATFTRRGGRKVTDAWELWGSLFRGRDGRREPPSEVAVLIHTWMSGG